MSLLYPFLFQPVYKDYLWGGDRIIRKYHRGTGPGLYAESWEVSDRPEGMSRVENGPLKGKSLRQILLDHGSEILGFQCEPCRFPLLIKLIDSKQDLSLQVHPNDENRHLTGGEAKTEMWYVLEADCGARVYSGFKEPLTDVEFTEQVMNGEIEHNMKEIPVQAGDAVFTPGGRVHAIGKGCLILEVQQNSNTTYRIYDWGRTDPAGNPRELHLEEARQVIEWGDTTPSLTEPTLDSEQSGAKIWTVLSTPFFLMRRIEMESAWQLRHDGSSFRVLFSPDKDLYLTTPDSRETVLPHGRTCLLPAAVRQVEIRPVHGGASVIEVFVP